MGSEKIDREFGWGTSAWWSAFFDNLENGPPMIDWDDPMLPEEDCHEPGQCVDYRSGLLGGQNRKENDADH